MSEKASAPEAKQENTELFVFPEREVQMEHYETLLLIPGTASEEEATAAFEAAKAELAALNAEITFEEAWGRKTLAYTVAKSRHGYYFVVEFNMDKANVATLTEKLRLRKDIARFMTVKKRQKSAEELAEEQRLRDKIAMKQQKEEEQAEAAEAQAEAEAVAKRKLAAAEKADATEEASEETKEEAPATEAKEEAVDIEKEIDKVLDEDMNV